MEESVENPVVTKKAMNDFPKKRVLLLAKAIIAVIDKSQEVKIDFGGD